ncbi:MAG: aspartate:alanine exchanger family transporter, partial [Rhodothermaceae bacterium]
VLLGYLFDIDLKLIAGIFTGALTSTPGLAAAIESTGSTLASIGFGIAYPFGVLGVILFVRLAPKMFNIKIGKEEEKYNQSVKADFPEVFNKNFCVENQNVFGKKLGELKLRSITGCNISRISQSGTAFTPGESTVLNKGDIIKAVGTADGLDKIKLLIGNETETRIPLSRRFIIKDLLVSNKEIVNKSLSELALHASYDATAARIRRAGIDIPPKASTRLQLGDKVRVACTEQNLEAVTKLFGDSADKLSQLDLLPITIGVILGILIGQISLPIFGMDFKLGLTGGVLMAALILSKIGRTGPLVWNVSGTINQFLRKIGLVFFLVSVGTNAGGKLLETISANGPELLVVGAVITIVPMVLALLVGRVFLKMNYLTLLGGLTGGMTSTPALSAIEPVTDSDAPKIGYATVYPFALVFVIIVSQVIGFLI